MRKVVWCLLIGLLIVLSACKPTTPECDENSVTYRSSADLFDPVNLEASTENAGPQELEINGRLMQFDQVIHGPLCNNHLDGKVYIACDIEIVAWEGSPNFFDDCDFKVSPGSVVYVAAHKNAAYYQGCDFCHVSQDKRKSEK
ncbi:MAG: hypothetical protein BGO78_10930 [Chloroflexi bacterium 44-23]|nr:MAG: hypothetical protein BGO78_10930 [Chloroflexi bacterium 44-23]